MKSVIHTATPVSSRTADLMLCGVHRDSLRKCARTSSAFDSKLFTSGGYIQIVYSQASRMVTIAAGRNAKNHKDHVTSTPPTSTIAPRAVIAAAPAMIILSKIVAVYVTIRKIPRATFEVAGTSNSLISPIAIVARMPTRPVPVGTMHGGKQQVMIKQSR